VFDNRVPVEVAVLRVDDQPVEAECNGHFGDAGGFERDPEAEHRAVGGEVAAKGLDGGSLHGVERLRCPSSDTGSSRSMQGWNAN
jgi:hypothetical protein